METDEVVESTLCTICIALLADCWIKRVKIEVMQSLHILLPSYMI